MTCMQTVLVIVCAVGAASCSRDELHASQAGDAGGIVTGVGGSAVPVGGGGAIGNVNSGGNVAGSGAGGRTSSGGVSASGGYSVSSGGTTAIGSGLGGTTGGKGGSAAGGSTTGAKPGDAGLDAAADAPSRELGGLDLFNEQMTGTWLVGWAGGLRHYSWVRLSRLPDATAEFLSGSDLQSNSPFWPCEGRGTWMITAAINSLMLRLPTSCAAGLQSYFTLQPFLAPKSSLPQGAILQATSSPTSLQPVEWFKFPPSQCDAAMASCTSPF